MSNKKYLILSGILIALSLTSIYIGSTFKSEIHSSYVYQYRDIQEIFENSDLVIRGIVSSKEYKMSEIEDTVLPQTYFTVEITQVVAGKTDLSEITIKQVGGRVGLQIVEVSDNPLMEVDEEVILFLREYEPNKYGIIGGPQGRFIIKNDKVYSVGEQENSITTSHLRTEGKSVTEFLSQLDSK